MGYCKNVQNFRSNLRPLNNGLEKNAFYNFNVEWSQLIKSVRDLQIGHILAKHFIKMGYPKRYFYRTQFRLLFYQKMTFLLRLLLHFIPHRSIFKTYSFHKIQLEKSATKVLPTYVFNLIKHEEKFGTGKMYVWNIYTIRIEANFFNKLHALLFPFFIKKLCCTTLQK